MVLVTRTSLLCFIVIGLLFAILATSTDFWVKLSVATLELNGGLWKICVKGKKILLLLWVSVVTVYPNMRNSTRSLVFNQVFVYNLLIILDNDCNNYQRKNC